MHPESHLVPNIFLKVFVTQVAQRIELLPNKICSIQSVTEVAQLLELSS